MSAGTKIYALIKLHQALKPWSRKMPTKMIYAQFAHETANFTSNIFKNNKNVAGMKVSRTTPGGFIEIGESNGHAVYKNYWDSVRDYFVRQRYFKLDQISDAAKYIEATQKSGYATDTSYVSKVMSMYNKIEPELKKKNTWVTLLIWLLGPTLLISAFLLIRWLIKYLAKKIKKR